MGSCVAGCKHYHGGGTLHHEDCPFYPDSISKAYRGNKEKLKGYEGRQADKMVTKVNGKEYITTFDSNNVQRFETNSVIKHLVDSGQVSLNNKFSYIDYMEFIMQTGYSISGFAELFPDDDIENPLWKKGE